MISVINNGVICICSINFPCTLCALLDAHHPVSSLMRLPAILTVNTRREYVCDDGGGVRGPRVSEGCVHHVHTYQSQLNSSINQMQAHTHHIVNAQGINACCTLEHVSSKNQQNTSAPHAAKNSIVAIVRAYTITTQKALSYTSSSYVEMCYIAARDAHTRCTYSICVVCSLLVKRDHAKRARIPEPIQQPALSIAPRPRARSQRKKNLIRQLLFETIVDIPRAPFSTAPIYTSKTQAYVCVQHIYNINTLTV